MTAVEGRTAALGTVRGYREAMARYAGMRTLEIWYDRTTSDDIQDAVVEFGKSRRISSKGARTRNKALFSKARGKDQLKAMGSLTTIVDGQWRIQDDPPIISHRKIPGGVAGLESAFRDYRASLADNRRELVDRYRFVDFALKVVGVGSVGTRCFVILLEGRDRGDPLILQAKEATASVLEPYVAASRYGNHGERVVVGQRLMQAAPDIFLGWTHRPSGRDFYFRQLWDMKGSVDIAKLEPHGLDFYGALCARTLARGHARSGDAVAISAYLGASDAFDGAVADLAETYADVNARDHAAFLAAIDRGAVSIPATDAAGRE
jgi:hypothetical protein